MKNEEINLLTLPPTPIFPNYWFCYIFIFNKVCNFHILLCNHSSQSCLVTVLHVNQFNAHFQSIYYRFPSWVLCSKFALSWQDFTFKDFFFFQEEFMGPMFLSYMCLKMSIYFLNTFRKEWIGIKFSFCTLFYLRLCWHWKFTGTL